MIKMKVILHIGLRIDVTPICVFARRISFIVCNANLNHMKHDIPKGCKSNMHSLNESIKHGFPMDIS